MEVSNKKDRVIKIIDWIRENKNRYGYFEYNFYFGGTVNGRYLNDLEVKRYWSPNIYYDTSKDSWAKHIDKIEGGEFSIRNRRFISMNFEHETCSYSACFVLLNNQQINEINGALPWNIAIDILHGHLTDSMQKEFIKHPLEEEKRIIEEFEIAKNLKIQEFRKETFSKIFGTQ